MCGIFGFSKLDQDAPVTPKEMRIVARFLAAENQTRGRESTGLAVIGQDGIAHTLKDTESARKFIDAKETKEFLGAKINKQTVRILGHTRYSTHGAVTVENAQPFIFENILGTHNGVINNFELLFKEKSLVPKTSCDSEIIFALLSMERTMKERARLLKEMVGYWAVAFHDFLEPDVLNFTRHTGPLTLAIDADKKFCVWSSLKDPVENLGFCLGWNLKYIDLEDGFLTKLMPDGTTAKKKVKEPWSSSGYSGTKYHGNYRDSYYSGRASHFPDWEYDDTACRNGFPYWHKGRRYMAYTPAKDPVTWGAYIVEETCNECFKRDVRCRYNFIEKNFYCWDCQKIVNTKKTMGTQLHDIQKQIADQREEERLQEERRAQTED